MDNQNPNPEPPAQFPIPPTEPLSPTQTTPLTQPIIEPIPIGIINPPPQTPEKSVKTIFYQNSKFKKSILIAAIIIATFLVINFIGGRFLPGKSLFNVTRTVYIDESDKVSPYDLYTPFPKYESSPEETPISDVVDYGCHSPLAPSGAGPVSKCNYRNVKASIVEAQTVMNRIYKNFGVTQIPDSLNFQEEIYKGIHIKWTINQPISTTTMAWIKNAIDIMPAYFNIDHPVLAIYSATPEDLQVKGIAPENLGAFAYESGLNIFFTKPFANGTSTQYVVNKEVATQALFHEWVHIIQFYDTLQTFTEKYLSIPGNASVSTQIDPITKDYAKTVGWVFQSDQYGDSSYAILGTDTEPQKQTDYGKTKYIEDMAEAGSYFMLCQNEKISEARIKWWEQTTGTNRNSYCPSRL